MFLFIFGRCATISNQVHQINEDIKDKEVRLVGPEGDQLGIVSSKEALRVAAEKDLDLVMIAPQAAPPVCKIMDYGKFRFEQEKREKEARKNQHTVEIKEIRLSPTIDEHDLQVKMKNAHKFLKSGDKVKVSVRFRGRAIAHTSLGLDVLKRFAEGCQELCNVEKEPKLDGRQMIMFLSPKN